MLSIAHEALAQRQKLILLVRTLKDTIIPKNSFYVNSAVSSNFADITDSNSDSVKFKICPLVRFFRDFEFP